MKPPTASMRARPNNSSERTMSAANTAWDAWIDRSVDDLAATARRAARLPFLWAHAQRVKKGVTPADIVYEEDHLKLLRYQSPARAAGSSAPATPLIFVFALVNRPYILDLKEGKSVV